MAAGAGKRLAERIGALTQGPGAVKLAADIKEIRLRFAIKNAMGHMGARKFWQEHLPRIAYRNPDVAITVLRHRQNVRAPMLYAEREHGPPVRLQLRSKHSTQICDEFVRAVGAEQPET